MNTELNVGCASVDITPPVGLLMAGGLDPRVNEGIHSSLLVSTLYADDGENRLAVIGADLLGMRRDLADTIISAVSDRTGIAPASILISCSHTHSGPYLRQRNHLKQKVVDEEYVSSLPGKFADSAEQAVSNAKPASMHIGRSLVFNVPSNRRVVIKKDGLVFNTWMQDHLNDLESCGQILGTAGPIDPELWAVRFDDEQGSCMGVLANFSMHACTKGGTFWSADYPGVIRDKIQDHFGEQTVIVFTPGACGNINNNFRGMSWEQGTGIIGDAAVEAAGKAMPVEEPVRVRCSRKDIQVKKREVKSMRTGAVERLNWHGKGGRIDVFGPRIEAQKNLPDFLSVPVSAASIGPLGIVSNPGELFVEWGLEIKKKSPFPYTIISELTNDSIGYQPDAKGFELEGYETLIGANRISLEGIQNIVESAGSQLDNLYKSIKTP